MVGSVWSGGKLANGSTWKGVGGSWGSGDFGTIAFGTVSGGAGAALTGGNFWQGAATGFTVTALNHAMHDLDPPVKKKETIRKLDPKYFEPQEFGMGLFEFVEGGGAVKELYEVYHLVNKETKVIEYVGKTKQGILKRFEQHLLDPTKEAWIKNVEPVLYKGGLTKFQAKYYEQTEILSHGLDKLYNKINGVAQKYWGKYGIK